MTDFWKVPPLWRDETCFIVAGGPSLKGMDLKVLAGRRVIAINDAYRLCPFAEILYFCDAKWWDWHKDKPAFQAFAGRLVKLEPELKGGGEKRPVFMLKDYTAERRRGGMTDTQATGGLEVKRNGVRTGRNSGYQCINLAIHLGATRIVLLGYDMRGGTDGRTHWFGDHPVPTKVHTFAPVMLPHFATLVEPLAERGVEVLNATLGSAIECFPKVKLADLL